MVGNGVSLSMFFFHFQTNGVTCFKAIQRLLTKNRVVQRRQMKNNTEFRNYLTIFIFDGVLRSNKFTHTFSTKQSCGVKRGGGLHCTNSNSSRIFKLHLKSNFQSTKLRVVQSSFQKSQTVDLVLSLHPWNMYFFIKMRSNQRV